MPAPAPGEGVRHECRNLRKEQTMLDHIQITVKNVAASKRFYASALAPLGLTVQYDQDPVVGIGSPHCTSRGGGDDRR